MWIYWAKLYESKFQASVVLQRMEMDAWLYGIKKPSEIEIFKSKKGKYGIRYIYFGRKAKL